VIMVSMFDIMAVWFAIGVPIVIGMFVAKKFGLWPAIGAGLLTVVPCVISVVRAYRARWRRNSQRRQEWKLKYSGIYRVIALPTDETVIKTPQGAEIKVGDYGWEAVPLRVDGLIYLQGLSPQWRVVWYAGFRPDQLEKVVSKPQSQYDWDNTWIKSAPPCPFPVQERETTDMGLPMPH
jgi:hypothetical protein